MAAPVQSRSNLENSGTHVILIIRAVVVVFVGVATVIVVVVELKFLEPKWLRMMMMMMDGCL